MTSVAFRKSIFSELAANLPRKENCMRKALLFLSILSIFSASVAIAAPLSAHNPRSFKHTRLAGHEGGGINSGVYGGREGGGFRGIL
jgi:hypothetical protein